MRRHDAKRLLPGQTLSAGYVPPFFEHRHVFVDEFVWRMVRRVLGTQAHVQKERLVGRNGLLLANEVDRLIDDIHRQVIVFVIRGFDMVVVEHQFRMPLVGFAFQKPKEAVKATLQRPLVVRAGCRGFKGRRQMPLASGKGVVALPAQHLGECAGAFGNASAHPRKAQIPIGQTTHPNRVVVATGQQRGTGWRAQCRRMKIGVTQSSSGQGIDVGRGNFRSVTPQIGKT